MNPEYRIQNIEYRRFKMPLPQAACITNRHHHHPPPTVEMVRIENDSCVAFARWLMARGMMASIKAV
jgi:hypothetical protein